jgi:uncharacterized membrane protein (GlpM family)
MGCLFSIVTLPFRAVVWLFKTWKWYVAFGIMAVITIAGVVIFMVATAKKSPAVATTTTITQASTIPSDILAPYLVQTSSLYYYAGKVTVSGNNYVLTPYWYFNSSSHQWVKSASLTITPNYGKIEVSKR